MEEMTVMTTNDFERSGSLRNLSHRLLEGVRRGFGKAWRRTLQRRELAALRRLEPWQLEDIGLTKEDLDWGLDLPGDVDARRAVSERAARRRADETAKSHRAKQEKGRAYRTFPRYYPHG